MPESNNISGSNDLRRALIEKIIQVARDNPDLDGDSLISRAESEAADLFAQLTGTTPSTGDKPKSRGRLKRKRHERKDHVGRFFLRMMEQKLRSSTMHPSLIPVFAKSVETLLGEEDYARLEDKIKRLLDFGEKKGYNYDQILDSKPGKMMAGEIIQLYQSESGSSWFEKKLKNSLDEALVKAVKQDPNLSLNIEDAINQAFEDFNRLLQETVKA